MLRLKSYRTIKVLFYLMLGHMDSKVTRLTPSAVGMNIPPFNGYHVIRLDSKNLKRHKRNRKCDK